MAVTGISGRLTYVRFLPDSGGTVELTATRTSFSQNFSNGLIETTAGSAESESYIKGINSRTFSWEGYYTGASAPMGSAVVESTKQGVLGTLEWGPEGNATGKPKFGVKAFIESQEVSYPYGEGAVTVSLSFTGTGDLTTSVGAVW